MRKNPDENNPQAIWTGQKRRHAIMSAEEVQQRVRHYQRRLRREGIIASVLSIIAVGVCVTLIATSHPAAGVVAVLAILVLLGLGAEAYKSYKTRKSIWPWLPAIAMTDRVPTVSIAFYRKGLERKRRSYTLPSFDVQILVLVLGASYIRYRAVIPMYFYVLLGVCIALIVFARRREANKVLREIRELDVFERGSEGQE
jgi:hypothetical protein